MKREFFCGNTGVLASIYYYTFIHTLIYNKKNICSLQFSKYFPFMVYFLHVST